MCTYTIFFCGTGATRNDYKHPNYYNGELIAKLASNMATPEYHSWIIVDGPGSGNHQEAEKWIAPGNHCNALGQLWGTGWDNNVQHAMAVLKKNSCYFDHKPGCATQVKNYQKRANNSLDVTQVNLVGWSRGGVTCLMMAKAMSEDEQLKHIPVNIFAIDPVPGMLRFSNKRCIIKNNVRDYYAVYARDERSFGFAPTIPKLENYGVTRIYSMPGRHATVVGNASLTGGTAPADAPSPTDLKEPGEIVRWLVESKLTEWGTQLKNTLNLTETEILQRYDKILADESKYFAMRSDYYIPVISHGAKVDRGLSDNSNFHRKGYNQIKLLRELNPNGDSSRNVFVNNHHQTLFINNMKKFSDEALKNNFPTTYRRINMLAPPMQ